MPLFGRTSPAGYWSFEPSGSPVGWWKADAITGLEDGDPVGTWSDSSGNSHDMTMPVAANKPTYKIDIQNGLPVVRFDGVNDYMRYNYGSTISQPTTIIFALNYNGTPSDDVLFDGYSSPRQLSRFASGETSYEVYAGSWVNSNVNTTSDWEILTIIFNGASSIARINGVAGSSCNPGSDGIDGLAVGGTKTGTASVSVDIGEIIQYSSAIDPSENESGLMTKWGIS